jgi:hypothetical protein
MPLTDRSTVGWWIVGTGQGEDFRGRRVFADTGAGAAGVPANTGSFSGPCGYASRCMPLLNRWRRMIFNRLE